jgi:predicted alpha-1,2-mannosidase
MNFEFKRIAGGFALSLAKPASVLSCLLAVSACMAQTPYSLVDPRLGTAHDGQTYPVVGTPFAMTGWTPETQDSEAKCLSPYYYKDTRITGFRGSHWLSGSCTQDYGSITLMPTTGELHVLPQERASEFSHADEISEPAYYSVLLKRYGTRVELAGAVRSGIMRLRYPEQAEANLIIEPYVKPGDGFVRVVPERNEVVGYNPVHRIYQASGQPAGFNGYFVIRFQQPMQDSGVWCDGVTSQAKTQTGQGCKRLGAFVRFGAIKGGTVLVKIGTSFTSLEEAGKNLDREIPGWSLEAVRQATQKSWQERLHRIEIEGGTPDQRVEFYTALFHASLAPRIVSDADGTYNGFAQEGKLHHAQAGTDFYDDFSLWDTFRALHPLLTIIDPDRDQQMIQSLIDKGEQGGYLPIFPSWNNYTSEMIGDHAVPVIVDAYVKGLRHFDVDAAYRLIHQSATITPPLAQYKDGKGRRALGSYLQYGYIPLEDKVPDAFHKEEQVSRTLEYAYDDFLVGRFAAETGHSAEAQAFAKRAGNWRNVFDPRVGFARGRHADGTWSEPFDPGGRYSYVTEGVPWQYTFFVPQDLPGLIRAVGGKDKFVTKLDGLFDAKLFEQNNEPSHHIPYLYDYGGAAWKTQERARQVMAQEYRTGPEGLPGNDDAGQMSAWFVFSAMGFYPVCPGVPSYALGSPLFRKVVVHLPSGKDFTLLAPESSAANLYIQSAQLGGHAWTKPELPHSAIVNGSTLLLHLGPKPNQTALKNP